MLQRENLRPISKGGRAKKRKGPLPATTADHSSPVAASMASDLSSAQPLATTASGRSTQKGRQPLSLVVLSSVNTIASRLASVRLFAISASDGGADDPLGLVHVASDDLFREAVDHLPDWSGVSVPSCSLLLGARLRQSCSSLSRATGSKRRSLIDLRGCHRRRERW